ncbi:MAG: FecR domain-containing protein [Bacteroidetes bacterium]|nr:FecR domain-containing protein [Bacteroidota bacterium]
MENQSTYHIDLITRYLAGEASGDDLIFLAEWLKADPEHQKIFDDYRKVWLQMEQARVEDSVDVDMAWKEMEARITEHEARSTEHESRKLNVPNPTSHIPDTGSTRLLTRYQQVLRLAAVILLLAVPSFLIYRYLIRTETRQLTAAETILEGKLPDGSAVTLNSGATLEYTSSFKGDKRNVKLNGEAWFEVKHDDHRPFIITRDKVRVEVLGTTFYVNTNAENGKMEVILNSGSVAVYYDDRPGEKIFLAPGEKAEVSLDQPKIEKDINTDQNYRSWMTKRFIYNHEPLAKVVADLNKVYRANLKISTPAVSNCLITATFDNQSVESILNVIRATLDLKVTNHGSWTELSGAACN